MSATAVGSSKAPRGSRRVSRPAGPGPALDLPTHATPLVARQHEIESVRDLVLGANRLVTLVGPPGIGKTRLAIAVAKASAGQFEDGVVFVDLSSINDAAGLLAALSHILRVRHSGGRAPADVLAQSLQRKQLLLVLDSFDRLVVAAPEIATLVAACRRVRVLVTSRSPLRVADEAQFPVPPLEVPDLAHLPKPEALASCPSVELFLQRAQSANPDFGLTAHNARAVAEICVRLEGLPLAIELAAARTRSVQTRAIVERLGHQLKLLVGGPRDLPRRHRTLRAAIAWSYELLSDRERAVLDRLSVFAGGCDVVAAQAVCAAESPAADIPDVLAALARRSLLQPEERPRGNVRYRVLESIREYAYDRLQESGVADRVHAAHAAFFTDLVERIKANYEGPEQPKWLDVLRVERQNIGSVLRWAVDRRQSDVAMRLAGHLVRYWEMHGNYAEGRRWLRDVLDGGSQEPVHRARALTVAGTLAYFDGDHVAALPQLEEALAIYREAEDRRAAAGVLNLLGILAMDHGAYDRATALLDESLDAFRALGDVRGIARGLLNRGLLAHDLCDFARARALIAESLSLKREMGDPRQVANALLNLGETVRRMNDAGAARPMLEEGLSGVQGLGDKRGASFALLYLGRLALEDDDPATARRLFAESLAIRRDLGYTAALTQSLDAVAHVAAAEQHPERAIRLFAAADALRRSLGMPLPPVERSSHDARLDASRRLVGDDAFAAAWGQGQTMSVDQALDHALAEERRRAPARVTVRLLGDVEVRRGDDVISRSAWVRRRNVLVFAYLLLAREPAPRDVVLDALWPDRDPAAAGASLNVAWSGLKRALEPHVSDRTASSYLLLKAGRYGVRWDAVSTDVQEFEGRVALAVRAATAEARIAHLEVATTLYRGDLLSEHAGEPWTTVERERLRLLYVKAMHDLAEARLSLGRSDDAVDSLRAVLRLDPWREESVRALMGALAALGRRAEALRVYRDCETLLRDELNVAPSAETRALYERIAAEGRGDGRAAG